MTETKHVVMFSGGAGSWCAAKRVAEKHGTDNLILLFADTMMEDEDLYRFLNQAAENVGGTLTILKEGRDCWQVFFDSKFLGNSRVDPCSRILKREISKKWVFENCDPENTILYVGIDWTEKHRLKNVHRNWEGWTVEFPMCDRPYLEKSEMLAILEEQGIKPPRLYEMGFPHNNCGGFCIKAGQAHFRLLLEKMPERYAYHEQKEQEIREHLGKDVAILRDRRGGKSRPLTLKELRERESSECDMEEWGGCGCFVDVEAENEEMEKEKDA